jgi:hypothetical protein
VRTWPNELSESKGKRENHYLELPGVDSPGERTPDFYDGWELIVRKFRRQDVVDLYVIRRAKWAKLYSYSPVHVRTAVVSGLRVAGITF